MVIIMWVHCVESSDDDNLNFCFAKMWSLFKTTDKKSLAKKILLRQNQYARFEAFLWHLGTLDL